MQHLAKAIVEALAFLELSGEDMVDPEAAVRTMEVIAATLQGATQEERDAVVAAAMLELNAQSANDAPEEMLDFYEHLAADLGLEED